MRAKTVPGSAASLRSGVSTWAAVRGSRTSAPSMRASDPVKMNTAAAPAEAASVFGRFDNATALQKSLMSMPSAVAQVGMTGLVAASGAAGYFLVPSQVLVRVVTGSLGALGGNVARKTGSAAA